MSIDRLIKQIFIGVHSVYTVVYFIDSTRLQVYTNPVSQIFLHMIKLIQLLGRMSQPCVRIWLKRLGNIAMA